MKSLAHILFGTITIVIFYACDKKNDPAPTEMPSCNLTKIVFDYGDFMQSDSTIFEYDDLVMIFASADSLKYDNNGNLTGYLIPARSGPQDRHEFTYSGEDIIKQEWFWTFDGSLEGRETYEYTNHRLTKLQEWFLDQNDHTWKEGDYKTFEYADDSTHNVSRMTFTDLEGVATTQTYEYGSEKSPYSALPAAVQKWYRVLERPTDNILTKINYSNGDVTTFLYNFNQQQLPSIRREYYNGDGIETQKYTYKCN